MGISESIKRFFLAHLLESLRCREYLEISKSLLVFFALSPVGIIAIELEFSKNILRQSLINLKLIRKHCDNERNISISQKARHLCNTLKNIIYIGAVLSLTKGIEITKVHFSGFN